MCKRINSIRKELDDLITKMSCNPESFVKKPGKDFTRSRKLDFSTVMRGILSMGGGSLSREMIRQTRFDMSHATASAFVQQRDKLAAVCVQVPSVKLQQICKDPQLSWVQSYGSRWIRYSDYNRSSQDRFLCTQSIRRL